MLSCSPNKAFYLGSVLPCDRLTGLPPYTASANTTYETDLSQPVPIYTLCLKPSVYADLCPAVVEAPGAGGLPLSTTLVPTASSSLVLES